MAYNSKTRRIGKIIYSSRTNSLKIVNQTSNDKRIIDDFELLQPSQNAINYVRNKTQDWSIMESYVAEDEKFNPNAQYKNWVIDFGNFDIRIISAISIQPIYRQKYDSINGQDDGELFAYSGIINKVWTITEDPKDTNKTKNVHLHYGIDLSNEGKIASGQTIYEVKLLIDISNPNIYT